MYSQKHIERLYAALGVLVLALSGSYAWDVGFAAGQEYEAWFCSNLVTP